MDAVELGGRRCTGRFVALNSYENRVYQLELEDGSMVVGKFYRPGRWSRQAIEAEHRFIQQLAEAEVPVAAPLSLGDGRTVGDVLGILYAVFPRVAGRSPQELSDEQARMLGRLVARMHNIGAQELASDRPSLTPLTFGTENLQLLVEGQHVHEAVRASYAATVQALVQRIEPLFAWVPAHRIHGDCHLGNLLWTRQGPVLVDFDDMMTGPAVQDIWMLAPSADSEGQRQRHIVLEGYREFRAFNDAWLRLVEPLRALRYVRYATWVARRWADPVFPRTFPHFGTQQYWEQQVLDLREQIGRIDRELEEASLYRA